MAHSRLTVESKIMRDYRLSFIKNIKRGFLTIPYGLITVGIIILILRVDVVFWQKILFILIFGSIGLPGLMIHLYYIGHDINVRISYNNKNDFFEFGKNGQTIKILKSDIESIVRIHRNVQFVLWYSYMMFKIRLKDGGVYSITNLSIEFDELYELTKIKGKQPKIFNKFRLI